MDIRDAKDSNVIHNIMAKRTSGIERESRLVVADNTRQAEMAEIAATREIEMSRQQAAEQVGLRTAEKDQKVGVANEQASQLVKVQQRETAAKEMDVVQVKNVRGAEIGREVAVIAAAQAKEVAIVQAEATKQVAIVSAEGSKQQTVLTAEGKLEAAKRNAEGIAVEGHAKGTAETAILMAPVDAQIKLAEKIGADKGYQEYLLGIRNIEAQQAVGTAQAEALKSAEVKVIANGGTPSKGLSNVMDLFSASGGTQVAGMLEALAQSDEGRKLLEKFAGRKDGTS
jgi:flotillin